MTSDLNFLHCGHNPHCRSRVDKHFNGYCTLQWMEAGAVELFYDQKRHELRNRPWFWPAFPGPHIRFHPARDAHEWNHRYVAFAGPRVENWKLGGLWPSEPQISPRGDEIAAQFDELLAHVERGGAWGTRRAVHLLEGLLLELAEARAATETGEAWLHRTRQFLTETNEFSPSYGQLARDLGMGLSTLRRLFKARTGLSLHEALLQNRLAGARRLLGETDLPLKQIAAQLGYRDVYFFSNQFKQLSGVSPAIYRKSRQE